MPTYLFNIAHYELVNTTEIEGDEEAPQTLINLDKEGTGNIALNAIDFAMARLFCGEHIRLHRSWDAPDLLQ